MWTICLNALISDGGKLGEAAVLQQVPCGYALVFCWISDGCGGFRSERVRAEERGKLPQPERRVYGRKDLAERLALALNVHYSPIIKPDKLTLPDWKFPANTAN